MAQSEGKIGSLFFGMTLDTTDFKKKLNSAKKSLKSAGSEMQSAFKSIAKGGLIVGTALAAGSSGMLFFAKNTLEATNAQLLLADSIGSTQAEIAGLELATEKWGVETSMVIDKMREVGGISAFKDMAEQVKNAGDEQAQLTKSIELFGNEGTKMLPLLQQGAQGFADMEAEARQLGLALSPEQIAKSRVAWEEYESTLMSIKGLGKQIGTAFLEPLGLIASGVKGFVATFKDDIIGGFKLASASIVGFLKGSFDLFSKFGIPFINGFISFAGQIGEAFSVLFDWLSPATSAAFGGLGSLFSGITDFLSTFKQSLIIGIATPIEFVLRGAFGLLAKLTEALGDILSEMAFGLAELNIISDKQAGGVAETFGDLRASMVRTGKDLAKPFADAIDTATNEMADIFIEQDKKNTKQADKFKSFTSSFSDGFSNLMVELPKRAVEASKEMARTISDKSAGLILSGSQAEQNIINQSQNKQLKIAQDSLTEQKKFNRNLENIGTF